MNKQVYQILSDNEESQLISKFKEHYENKIFESDNLLLKTFDVVVNVVKKNMEGSEIQKNLRIQKRLNQLYEQELSQIKMGENICKKREPNYMNTNQEQIRPIFTQVIVYGAELWPLKKIRQSLAIKYQNYEVTRLDKSHVKINFDSEKSAWDWLKSMALQPELLSRKLEEDDQNDHSIEWKGWIELKPYQYLRNLHQKRQARFAASNQQNLDQLSWNQNQKDMQQIKERITRKILQDYQAEDKFDQMMSKRKQIEDKCNKKRKNRRHMNKNQTYDFERSRNQGSFYDVSLRERSREKPNRTIPKEPTVLLKEEPSQNPSDMSFNFILSEGERSSHPHELSFVKEFDKKLHIDENEFILGQMSLQKPNNNSLQELLNQEQKYDLNSRQTLNFRANRKADPNFSYTAYLKEQEKQQNQIIHL